jgi:hypothetical protein
MKGVFIGVTKEQFNHWLMFEFKASGGKRNAQLATMQNSQHE